eukprot:CAMPEP_0194148264 /NCGR_PEP_ID=MMETSP0152-20130528/31150_1 /TAXON_ID=1049557 /ORGANISM="Thalassiothrix antarctica, Strain L6-D1" /LENGTH=62 /DNA_ID=CAMNT_0038849657 /DNA_START=53 /DNA_END=238 /DNA_ORIENTATION=-
MMVTEEEQKSTAGEKLERVWRHVVGKSSSDGRKKQATLWPSYNDVFKDVRNSDYNEMLTCPL